MNIPWHDGPLLPAETVCAWGATLVVAPHPDDDVLGCGGAIGLLRRFDRPVRALFVSDGAASHPKSRRFPPSAVRALRAQEAREGLARLGVPPEGVTFLDLPDGSVPAADDGRFASAVRVCADHLDAIRPETLLLPWRRDPHPDHRATGQMLRAALATHTGRPRLLEYPIWAWERASGDDLPRPGEVRPFRLDIGDMVSQKRSAIMAHKSQVTTLIDDDPEGCLLSPEMLAHFARPWEIYLEVLSW